MPPPIHDWVNLKRGFALRPLGYTNQSTPRVQLLDDPVAIIGLVAEKGVKLQALDEGRNTDRIVAIAWQQDEANQIAKGIRQRQNLGRPSTLRLAYSLTQSPPFEP